MIIRPLFVAGKRHLETVAVTLNDDCNYLKYCYHFPVNSKHRKTLDAIMAEPVNGNIAWSRIEALFMALGCRVVEGSGSAVTFEHHGRKANFHRPHPGRESLRYRVKAAREFLVKMGATS